MTAFERLGHILAVAGHFLGDHNGAVTVGATVFIAAFTIVLALVTRGQARLTRTAAEAAHRSAAVAERALVEVERPWLFLEGATITVREDPPVQNSCIITLTFRNVGRMPASSQECIFKIVARYD